MQTLNNSITVSHEATESFSDLPIDALVEIYRQLSSISDVINLSQTCRALQEIWLDNVVTIYTSVGPQSIPCERHALAFRGYQSQLGGPFNRTSITSRDVHQIMKNNKVIQKSIKDFEELFLPLGIKVCIDGSITYEKATGHRNHNPEQLTAGERSRFVGSYYQVWSLLESPRDAWENRLQSVPLKQLFHLKDMAMMGSEAQVYKFHYPWMPVNISYQPNDEAFKDATDELAYCIETILEQRYHQIHGTDPERLTLSLRNERSRFPMYHLWDCCQRWFHRVVVLEGENPPDDGQPNERFEEPLERHKPYIQHPELWYEGEFEDEQDGDPVEVLRDGVWIWL